MKINSVSNRRKWIVITAVAIVAIGGGMTYAYYRSIHTQNTSSSSSHSVNLGPATDDEKNAGNQAKSSSADVDTSSNSIKNGDSPNSNTPSTTVDVQLSANSQNGSVYQIRYLISSVIINATCTLTMTKGAQTITKTASVQALAQSSTCQGFDIPTSELNSGSWKTDLVVTGNNITGSTENTIQIQ